MVKVIDPARFTGRTLSRRPIWRGVLNDCDVLVDGLSVGRIVLTESSQEVTGWFWTLTAPATPPEMGVGNGDEPTLEKAQDAFYETLLALEQMDD
jgi:hypothetical protein